MHKITVYNNLTKSEEDFSPISPSEVKIYTCGPTVYDHSHIGHARSSITWDFIVRFLRHLNYDVKWTRNITDIDDKIINRAKELNEHPAAIARKYIRSFYEDMIALNIDWPDYEPRATQFIPDMYEFISGLIKKESAYQIDTDVYFSISSFANYGRLKGQSIADLEKGFGRIEPNPKKKHPLDFALWKGAKNTNEYCFESPWGKGRPGWHLECSAMNHAIYGDQIDIHGGGDDLIFPHHENEIAQSESLTKKTFAKYWLHNGMIMVNGKKMAKSEGNFITIKGALKTTTNNAIRFFVLNSHYRMPLNYTEEAITAAQNGIYRLVEALSGISASIDLKSSIIQTYINEFNSVLSDDFNSPQALSILFKLVDKINTENNVKTKTELQNTLLYLSNILGFNLLESDKMDSQANQAYSKVIDKLIEWRTDCKIKKDFTTADRIRDLLNECKIEVKDLSDNKFKWQVKL